MSEPRIISPLLDGFALGGEISSHSGVNCYPAMRADSDEKYIVKTITIPASQTRLEALLLTGAYPDAQAAGQYFQELAEGVVREAEILSKLSKKGGFLPYRGCQVEPLEDGVGYQVYLVSEYRQSLERWLRRKPMTHLAAVNMGIDLCAAMVVCRESGYLYVDLRPGNVFLVGDQGYHIGDLGFVSLDSLQYASLPDRCRSNWTAPEVGDAFATLNTTMDTFALGLMLYQVYNNGTLPFDSQESKEALFAQAAAGEPLPAPAYADYEMAQIILKACAPNPDDRWKNPTEMGRALVAYMQRNGANDVPIGPPTVSDDTLIRPIAETMPEQELPVEEEPQTPETDVPTETAGENTKEQTPPTPEEPDDADAPAEETETEEEAAEQEAPDEPEAPAEPESDWIDRMGAILAEDSDPDSEEEDIPLRELLTGDEFVPEADVDDEVDTDKLTEEGADMLSQAEDLITHEVPEPAVAPDPIDIPIPEPIVLPDDEAEEEADGENTSEEAAEGAVEITIPQTSEEETPSDVFINDVEEDEPLPPDLPEKPKRSKKWIGWLIALIVIALLGYGVYYAYHEFYLQEVTSLTVDGDGDQMRVSVVSEADQSLLTVVCVDQYGKKRSAPLTGGCAEFTDLDPDTQYNISLEIEGYRKLSGQITAQYYTQPQVSVTSFTSVTGPEDGSVILNFTTEGPTIENWTVQYGAVGEPSTSVAFTGSTITISGLTPGAQYEFTLLAGDEVQLIGQNQISHTASALILAENLLVIGNADGSMTATWTAPEGISVESWTARCYNDAGYDQSMEVTEASATFAQIDPASSYTVEITAAGMTQSSRIYVTANPIHITSVTPSAVGTSSLAVTWEFEGNAPEDGWLLLYTVDQGTEQHVIQCPDPLAVIDPVAPGSHYDFTVQAASAVTVFGGTGSAEIPAAAAFQNYGLAAKDISLTLCLAPEEDGWSHYDVAEEDQVSSFTADQTAGIILRTNDTYNVEYYEVTATYVIRDMDGKLACMSTTTQTWESMWRQGYCELTIPTLPANPGSYTLELYFDGALVGTHELSIA